MAYTVAHVDPDEPIKHGSVHPGFAPADILGGMEFFVYHRDRAGSAALRHALVEQHWSYMDRFADGMIARGPTFAADGETLTGSVHIVDLPDAAAARAFAFDEPNYQAGAYRDVMIRRWHNRLGRTMRDFTGGRSGLLVLGLAPAASAPEDLPAGRDALIAYGPLLSDDGAAWLGTAALSTDPAVLPAGDYAELEVHRWAFGGRPE